MSALPAPTRSGGLLPGGRVEFRATTLLGLIAFAWSVRPEAIAGGPPWLDTDTFDVVAKAPASASEIALRNMLRNLLADRFGLSIQTEEKPQPVFALVMENAVLRRSPLSRANPSGSVVTRTTPLRLLAGT